MKKNNNNFVLAVVLSRWVGWELRAPGYTVYRGVPHLNKIK
jgi:hypothetical protein